MSVGLHHGRRCRGLRRSAEDVDLNHRVQQDQAAIDFHLQGVEPVLLDRIVERERVQSRESALRAALRLRGRARDSRIVREQEAALSRLGVEDRGEHLRTRRGRRACARPRRAWSSVRRSALYESAPVNTTINAGPKTVSRRVSR